MEIAQAISDNNVGIIYFKSMKNCLKRDTELK